MYFEGYGNLEFLEPEEFYKGGYIPVEIATGEDGEEYDIVILGTVNAEFFYTNV